MSLHSAETDVLMHFLSFSPEDSLPVLREFAALDRARSCFAGMKNNFVYIPGTRKDRVLLVAHTDTVWDRVYMNGYGYEFHPGEHKPVLLENGTVRQGGWPEWGLGADDRAGCAILWLLRLSGHSLLLTDGEEHGQVGAHFLMDYHPETAAEINAHRYMIQLDRRNSRDYKTYALDVTDRFRLHVRSYTGYEDAGSSSRTDIVALCRRICGVNLSIGYYQEHTPGEYLVLEHWLNTYHTVRRMLEGEQPQFLLKSAE